MLVNKVNYYAWSAKALCFWDVRPQRPFFIHWSGQILLPWYLMNVLSNFDETYTE